MAESRRTERFPRGYRLRKRAEFLRVQNEGVKLHLSRFLVFAIGAQSAGCEDTRLGITVTRKVGHAVLRNRIKRWVREAFRRERIRFPQGWDLVFVAKRQCAGASFADVHKDVRDAVRLIARRCARS